MARRNAPRLVAALALLAIAAVVVLALGGGDDGDSGRAERAGGGAGADGGRSRGDRAQAVPRRPTDPVRNASPQPGWGPYGGPVPIFRYHAVGEFPAGEPYPELFVEPADFAAQMGWLQEHGYEAVDLRAVERAWFDGGTLPRRPVVLSFDGVEAGLARVVLPELSRRGWPGVVVLDGEAPLQRQPLVERLLAAGWEVEAGGVDAASRRLEVRLGTPIVNFSFPADASDEAGAAAVEAAGYEGATVAGAGFATSSEPFAMPRITVFGLAGVDGFAEAMRSRGEGVGA